MNSLHAYAIAMAVILSPQLAKANHNCMEDSNGYPTVGVCDAPDGVATSLYAGLTFEMGAGASQFPSLKLGGILDANGTPVDASVNFSIRDFSFEKAQLVGLKFGDDFYGGAGVGYSFADSQIFATGVVGKGGFRLGFDYQLSDHSLTPFAELNSGVEGGRCATGEELDWDYVVDYDPAFQESDLTADGITCYQVDETFLP